MKKKLTLSVDEQLVERMKALVSSSGLSLSAVVEQFFAQQLSRVSETKETQVQSSEDPFISKFGGIISGYGTLTDAEIREMVYSARSNHSA
ncbi:MAG: DUF6364 family protein [Bacteroidota bacterium]